MAKTNEASNKDTKPLKTKRNFGAGIRVLWHDKKRWCGLPWSFTHYYLVEKPGKYLKLVEEIGWISKQIEEVQLFRIDDLSISRSAFNVLYGVGNITIYCKEAAQDKLLLRRIKDPMHIYNMLCDKIEDDKERKGMMYSEFQRQ